MSNNYVVDANVLFGAFISGRSIYQLFFSSNKIYLPDYIFLEIDEYRERILNKTKLESDDFKEFVLKLLKKVIVVPTLLISDESLKKAKELCGHIDEEDMMYVAASVEFGYTLVTNDKKLYKGLKDSGVIQIDLLENILRDIE